MGRLKDKQLFEYIYKYFTEYLPMNRSGSEHTLRSYRTAVNVFLEFLKQRHEVTLFDVTFSMITQSALQDYLAHLRSTGISDTTCRHRITALKAFLKYCADMDATLATHYTQTETVPVKWTTADAAVEYLSEKAIRVLMEQPDPTTTIGQRDRFFLILLYDTGARVEELVSARLSDIQIDAPAKMHLLGKGKKRRTVPLSDRTVQHYKQYLKKFHPADSMYSDEYIFYTIRKGVHCKMCSDTVRRFMKKYGLEARKYCPEIPENVHPHLFRHSRAMHLYQGGMDLTLVSQWLGHANLQTTLIYAHADTELKRKAIELATGSMNPTKKNTSTSVYTVTDEETLRKLYGLK